MWVLPAFAAIQIILMLDVLRQAFIPPLVVFSALMTVALIAVVARPGRWTYLGAAIVFILVTAGNAPIIIDGIIHPVSSSLAWPARSRASPPSSSPGAAPPSFPR
jgi:hypothetical protein